MSDDGTTGHAQEPPPDKSLTWMPLLGAAVVAAVVVLILVLTGSGKENHLGTATDADGALSCPKTYEVNSTAWVPIDPAGVDGKKSLVPDTKPGHATVCHYPTSGSPTERGDARLAGRRTLGGDLRAITRGLSKLPKSPAQTCAARQAAPGGSYLLGLNFATGVVWVSAPGEECLGSTNGVYQTSTVRTAVQSAYDARAWVG
ncbi:MAG: hypothetical protein ACR2LX_01780 [Jatrophihabitans sp.]